MNKFKARGLTSEGQWVYGYVILEGEETYIVNKIGDDFKMTLVIPDTVGRFYKSLSADDGEKMIDIYEGDVVSVERYKKGECYIVKVLDISSRNHDDLFGSAVLKRRILGNIHKPNKEILKFPTSFLKKDL